MASPAAARSAPLQPEDWIQAARSRLAREGIDSVRIEVLCRDLGVSKGSFYWHFRDREDLLHALLSQWEKGEEEWLKEARSFERSAAARWARLVERGAQPDRIRLEAAIRAWARQDDRVARRVAVVEKKQREHISGILRDIGFARRAAEEWSEMALILYLGWLDRSTRDPEFQLGSRALGDLLSELILAASAQSGNSPR
ncbi:MAG TPA: TetR/AcrR family transcriptional regulator [Candidatus Limnocylindrales bacterium]|nr:TetR/AcrR family transcriptional regulator [Candidatus Limnocylindrales bacterium]